jgi:hypothetical protein
MADPKDVTLFKQAREAAKRRLQEVEQALGKLENERLSLQATVTSLDELLDEGTPTYSSALAEVLEAVASTQDGLHPTVAAMFDPLHGMTEAVRKILNIVPSTGMQAAEIAKLMEQRGFDFSKYNNPVQPVHTVLTRLCTQRDPDAKIIGRTPGGRPLYAPTRRNAAIADAMNAPPFPGPPLAGIPVPKSQLEILHDLTKGKK